MTLVRSYLIALCVGASSAATGAVASAPTVDDCLEASDFIEHAAQSRDNGMTRDAFMTRLSGDFALIRAFPPELRWFAKDEDDERFLAREAEQVFDAPSAPADHRRTFLRACFERLGGASA